MATITKKTVKKAVSKNNKKPKKPKKPLPKPKSKSRKKPVIKSIKSEIAKNMQDIRDQINRFVYNHSEEYYIMYLGERNGIIYRHLKLIVQKVNDHSAGMYFESLNRKGYFVVGVIEIFDSREKNPDNISRAETISWIFKDINPNFRTIKISKPEDVPYCMEKIGEGIPCE